MRAWYVGLLLLLSSHVTWAADVQAVAGRPFGVARITLPMGSLPAASSLTVVTRTNGFRIDDPAGRVFYPAFAERRVLGVLRELLGGPPLDTPGSVTAFFLFRGDDPFQVTLHTPQPETITVVPMAQPRRWQRLMRNWWSQYSAVAELQEQNGDYPPLVETYLTNMLEQRLNVGPRVRRGRPRPTSTPQKTLQLVFNIESLRYRAMEDTLAGRTDNGVADRPLPNDIVWPERQQLPPPGDVKIEALAEHVPDDCFYVRFGSFANYLWLKGFLEKNGGDVGQMAMMRGHDALLSKRTQEQLGLKETVLSQILGGQVISDMALIGRDTYLREGAAIGVLFEARNGLLAGELLKQRRAAVTAAASNGATLTEIMIDDTKVSVATSADNRLRSFQVAVDNYHLVTTSRWLVERFLQLSKRGDSIAKTHEFRLARFNYPVDNEAAVFAYLSPAFFRGLVSPQYQIELRRRLRAVTDLELVQLAALAAAHEGAPHQNAEELIAGGFLPPQFLRRADGSRIVGSDLSDVPAADSLRGARGSFLPIPDVPLAGVTVDEEREYAEIAEFHRSHWTQMDPLVVQMRRQPLNISGRTRIEIDAEMLPFDREKYGVITSVVGPATRTRIHQSSADAIAVQVVLQGGTLRPGLAPHHLFFGIQDREIPVSFSPETFLRVLQVLRTAPAYLGAWPKLGLLDMIPLGQFPSPDASGMSRLPFGLFRQQTTDGFSLIGFDPQVLADASRELAVEEAETEAQIRVHVIDVTQSQIKTWFAALDFQRAYQTSVGNTRLLHAIQQQFGVTADQALPTAEAILGVELRCALGGKYQLTAIPQTDQTFWASTHWPELRGNDAEPAQFVAPIMAWFRGLDAEVTLKNDRVTGHISLDIQQ